MHASKHDADENKNMHIQTFSCNDRFDATMITLRATRGCPCTPEMYYSSEEAKAIIMEDLGADSGRNGDRKYPKKSERQSLLAHMKDVHSLVEDRPKEKSEFQPKNLCYRKTGKHKGHLSIIDHGKFMTCPNPLQCLTWP